MGKTKENPLLSHLLDPAFHDEASPLSLPGEGNRLRVTPQYDAGDWTDVAKIVWHSASLGTAWFPDANVAILKDAEPVWDAFRLAPSISSRGFAIFTKSVQEGLREWLAEPRRNLARAEAISDALTNRTWAREFGVRDLPTIAGALVGYMRLLAFRRYLAIGMSGGSTILGTDPKEKCKTMNVIANKIGRRALLLARKGRIDAERAGVVNINDELHCLLAICYSLLTGRESVILTSDVDFTEIFYKAQWFFDTHYRAYLAAKAIRSGSFGRPVKTLDNCHGYFDGGLALYKRRTSHLREVLPNIYHQALVSVIYVAPDGTIRKMGFSFEREMLDMLETRTNTQGRCTDLFGDQNIHIDLGPLKPDLDGPVPGNRTRFRKMGRIKRYEDVLIEA